VCALGQLTFLDVHGIGSVPLIIGGITASGPEES
jgi:hypothetical protein